MWLPKLKGSIMATTHLTPEQRTLRARNAALTMHATHDSKVTSKPGRDRFLARFEREIDEKFPGLDAEERARRVDALRRAYFVGLAFASSKARRRRADRRSASVS